MHMYVMSICICRCCELFSTTGLFFQRSTMSSAFFIPFRAATVRCIITARQVRAKLPARKDGVIRTHTDCRQQYRAEAERRAAAPRRLQKRRRGGASVCHRGSSAERTHGWLMVGLIAASMISWVHGWMHV